MDGFLLIVRIKPVPFRGLAPARAEVYTEASVLSLITNALIHPHEDRAVDDGAAGDRLDRRVSLLPGAAAPADRGLGRAEIGRAHAHGRVQRCRGAARPE